MRIADKHGDIFSKCWGYRQSGRFSFRKGTPGRGSQCILQKASGLGEMVDITMAMAIAYSHLGEILFETGEIRGRREISMRSAHNVNRRVTVLRHLWGI